MKRPFCPHCGRTLIFFEHYDYSEDVNEEALFFADGHCPQCYREYRWTDVYKLDHFDDFEEVKKDEDY